MIGETTVLITGKRGNGKSLKAVGLMKQEIAEGRPTYASNFEGLNVPGVQLLDDPRQWETLPPGSILFVDEAQRFWRARRSGEPPAELQAMETQRHLGICIVLLTQQPTYLDKHIRGLVDLHHHLMLDVGGKASRCYTWKRCIDDCEEASARDTADTSLFLFPKADFGSYASAEVHTIKPKIPRKLKLIAAAAVLVVGMFYYALSGYTQDAPAAEAGTVAAGALPLGNPPAATGARGKDAPLYTTAEGYWRAFKPRIEAMPWTAPAFDDREVVSEPRAFCAIAHAGPDASGQHQPESCHCLTEQGTRYGMSDDQCRILALNGEAYNPFKRPAREKQQGNPDRGAGVSPAVTAPSASIVPQAQGTDHSATGTL